MGYAGVSGEYSLTSIGMLSWLALYTGDGMGCDQGWSGNIMGLGLHWEVGPERRRFLYYSQ